MKKEHKNGETSPPSSLIIIQNNYNKIKPANFHYIEKCILYFYTYKIVISNVKIAIFINGKNEKIQRKW